MDLEKLKSLNQAYETVAEQVFEHPNAQGYSKGEVVPAETLKEVDSLFSDFFGAENSERFGDIHAMYGDGPGEYQGLERTLKISDGFSFVLVHNWHSNAGGTEESYVVDIDLESKGDAAKVLAEAVYEYELTISQIAEISNNPYNNGSAKRVQDSLETMRTLHAIAFGNEAE